MTQHVNRRNFGLISACGLAYAMTGCSPGRSFRGSDVGEGMGAYRQPNPCPPISNRVDNLLTNVIGEGARIDRLATRIAPANESITLVQLPSREFTNGSSIARCLITCEPLTVASNVLPFRRGQYDPATTEGGRLFFALAAADIGIGVAQGIALRNISLRFDGQADGSGFGQVVGTYQGEFGPISESVEGPSGPRGLNLEEGQNFSNFELACLRSIGCRERTKEALARRGVDYRRVDFPISATEHRSRGPRYRKASFEIEFHLADCT